MNPFDGLYFYEIVLMVGGVLLFAALLFVLVYNVTKNRSIKPLLLFFVVPIVMIGFPGIQSIKISGDGAEITRLTEKYREDPTDDAVRDSLSTRLAEIEDRPISNPSMLLDFADASAAVGDTTKAFDYVNKVLEQDPNSQKAVDLRARVRVEIGLRKLEQNPADTTARNEVVKNLPLIEKSRGSNAFNLLTAAKAHAVMGDTAKAFILADSAVHKRPTLKAATQFKKNLQFTLPKKRR